jgi:hypothetical protein
VRRFSVLVASSVVALAGLESTASMSVQPAAAASSVAGSGRSVAGERAPAGFRAQSIAWISSTNGRMLGTVPCARGMCTTVLGTSDGGDTWSLRGTMAAPLAQPGEPGVTRIRFADDLHGWAFGPSLVVTSNGGRSWKRDPLPGGGRQVIALGADRGVVYVVVSPCRIGQPEYKCKEPSTLWRAKADGELWHQVPVDLPVTFVAVLAVHGKTAYLAVPRLAPEPDVFSATVDGRQWTSRPSPCLKDQDEALVDVAPMSDRGVALLCLGDPGFGKSVKRAFRSDDTGFTTSPAGTAPLQGIASQLAATHDGTMALASWSSGSWIYRNGGGETWTTAVERADGGAGWNDIAFTTNTVGFVVYAPAAWADGAGELWKTVDAGAHWAPVGQEIIGTSGRPSRGMGG